MSSNKLSPSEISQNEDSGKHIENKINSMMESVASVLIIFISTYFILITPSLVEMHTFLSNHQIKVNLFEYFWTVVGALLSFALYKFSTTTLITLWSPFISPVIVRHNESTEQRVHRLGDYIYKTIYYTWSWCTLMYMTYGSIFSPSEFGGQLDIEKSLEVWPYEVNLSVRIFYMLTLGHHFERLAFELMHNRKASSFFTMTFHHLVTVMLIFLSFYTRHLMFGIPILLTHDFNDIFLNACRFWRESLFPTSASVAFMIMMISWFYTRIFMYAKYVLYGLLFNMLHLSEFVRRFFFVQLFFVPALLALFILNLFWFFQIFRVFVWRFVKKDKNLPFEDFKTKKNK